MGTFGDRLVLFRQNKHYNQVQFAELMGIQRQALLRYEKNIIKPSFEFLYKLTILFPDEIQYLLLGDKQTQSTKISIPNQLNSHISEKEIEILNAYRDLTEEDQEIFYHELKAAAAKARKKAKENENIIHEDVKSVG